MLNIDLRELQNNLTMLPRDTLVYLSGVVDGLLGRSQLATEGGEEE